MGKYFYKACFDFMGLLMAIHTCLPLLMLLPGYVLYGYFMYGFQLFQTCAVRMKF